MSQTSSSPQGRAFASREGWYAFRYPDSWEVEEHDGSVAVYNPERGVGALHISAYETPGSVNPKEALLEMLSDSEPSVKEEEVSVTVEGSKRMTSLEQVKDHSFQKTWLISENTHAVLATYDCEDEDRHVELPEVEKIVRSIEFSPKISRN